MKWKQPNGSAAAMDVSSALVLHEMNCEWSMERKMKCWMSCEWMVFSEITEMKNELKVKELKQGPKGTMSVTNGKRPAQRVISFHFMKWIEWNTRSEGNECTEFNQFQSNTEWFEWNLMNCRQREHCRYISFMISFHAFSFTSVNAVRTNEWRYYNSN